MGNGGRVRWRRFYRGEPCSVKEVAGNGGRVRWKRLRGAVLKGRNKRGSKREVEEVAIGGGHIDHKEEGRDKRD